MRRQHGNAEGYCRACGAPLGIGGQCGICAMREMEERNSAFFQTRTLSWWRVYWRNACEVLSRQLGRPLTRNDKWILLRHWREQSHMVPGYSVSSYTALALTCWALAYVDDPA